MKLIVAVCRLGQEPAPRHQERY